MSHFDPPNLPSFLGGGGGGGGGGSKSKDFDGLRWSLSAHTFIIMPHVVIRSCVITYTCMLHVPVGYPKL